jgi:hypothetical protein
MITTHDESAQVAATIHRLTPRLSQLVHEDSSQTAAHEAVVLLKYLEPGRGKDAILAHRAFMGLVSRELELIPAPQPEYVEILDQLWHFLEAEGWRWGDGRWVPPADEPTSSPRLAVTGAS